jgi:HEAT repeat protein
VKEMGLFGPPNVEKMKAKRDIDGLIKAVMYRKDYWNENVTFDKSLREDVMRVAAVRVSAARALGEIGDPRAVDPLIQAFDDKVMEVRDAAVDALGKIGKPAVQPLGAVLQANDWHINRSAAKALGRIGDTLSVDYLIAALGDEKLKFMVRDDVITALGLTGDTRAVEPLIHRLKEEGQSVSANVVRVLGDFHDLRAIEPLKTVLKNKDERVRKAAAESLDKLGWKPDQTEDSIAYWLQKDDVDQCVKLGSKAVESLIDGLKNDNTLVPAAAALGRIGDTRAVKPLIAALKSEKQEQRIAAVQALGQIRDGSAVEPLITAYGDEPMIFCRMNRRSYITNVETRRSEPLKKAVVTALIQMGYSAIPPIFELLKSGRGLGFSSLIETVFVDIGPAAVNPLVAVLNHPDTQLRYTAASILVRIGNPSIQPLTDLLLNKDKALQELAVSTLDKLKWQPTKNNKGAVYFVHKRQWTSCVEIGKPAVEPLINVLRDKDVKVREKVAQTLGKIGDSSAVPALIAAAKDKEYQVRCEVLEALVNIGDSQVVEVLINALKDQHFRVRYTAVEGLAKIGDARVVDPIIALLKDKDVLVSRTSAWALGEFGDSRAVEPLIALLERNNVDSDVRRAAARSLVALYSSASTDVYHKQAILALRSTIVGTSKPHIDQHTDWGCTGSHSDSPAIKVEFPL